MHAEARLAGPVGTDDNYRTSELNLQIEGTGGSWYDNLEWRLRRHSLDSSLAELEVREERGCLFAGGQGRIWPSGFLPSLTGLGSLFSSLPTACAVGCILSPLRGWGLPSFTRR